MLRLTLTCLLLLGACAPSADPERQAALDAWSAGVEDKDLVYGVAAKPAPLDLAVGQWIEYRTEAADGTVAVRQLTKIVAQEGDRFWIEHEIEDPTGWFVRATLIEPDYDQVMPVNVEPSRSLVQPSRRVAFSKTPDKPLPIAFDPGSLQEAGLDRADVPAGVFEARKVRVLDQSSGKAWGTQWFHGDVPIYGTVLTRWDGGGRAELVGFGLTGARSKVVELAAKQLEQDREALGEAHPETLKSMTSLADAYRRQGSTEEAEKLYRETLDISWKELGGEHADTILTMYKFAFFYDSLGRYEDSGKLWAILHVHEELWKHFPSRSSLNADLAADVVELYRIEGRDPANRGGVAIDNPFT